MLVSTRLALGLLGLCSLAQAQPPAPLPLEKVPHTREAMISWIRQQTAMGDRTATVSLADGTVLRGAVSGPDADGALLLATALAQAPLRVPAERVTKVEYRAQEKLTWSPPVRIDFRDGSWALAATVRALDGKEMLFDLPYAQDIRVPLSAVARVAFDGLAGPQPGSVANVEVFLGKRLLQAPQLELDNVDLRLFDGAQRLVPRGGRAVTLAPVPSSVAAPSRGRMRLRNGDLLTGVVQQLKADRLSFKMALGPELEVSTDDIAEVVLPWVLAPQPRAEGPARPRATVTLLTGERWRGLLLQVTGTGVSLGWMAEKPLFIPFGLIHSLSEIEPAIAGPRQWASAARASSEYSRPSFSAEQACGAPNTPVAGDHPTAWAPRAPEGGAEWLELTYASAVHATRVRIRETYNPGAVVRVEVLPDEGEPRMVWEGRDMTKQAPGWLELHFARTPEPVRAIRIHLDTKRVNGWNEIDAVELIGEPVEGE